MLVTKNQIYVFIACIAFGVVSGVLFGILSILKIFLKYKILRLVPDVLAGLITGVLFVLYAYVLNFPTLRVYMVIGIMLGLVGYFKSFNIILAKSMEKIYNIYKSKKVRRKNDRIKVQKARGRRNSRRGDVNDNTDFHNGVSVNFNRSRKQAN